jgi:hypothetical protein
VPLGGEGKRGTRRGRAMKVKGLFVSADRACLRACVCLCVCVGVELFIVDRQRNATCISFHTASYTAAVRNTTRPANIYHSPVPVPVPVPAHTHNREHFAAPLILAAQCNSFHMYSHSVSQFRALNSVLTVDTVQCSVVGNAII